MLLVSDLNKMNEMIKDEWKELGYVNEPIPEGIDIKAEIRRMCKEKNAVIMAIAWHWLRRPLLPMQISL